MFSPTVTAFSSAFVLKAITDDSLKGECEILGVELGNKHIYVSNILIFFSWFDSRSGPRPPFYEVPRSHSNTSHSVALPWKSDQLVAENST